MLHRGRHADKNHYVLLAADHHDDGHDATDKDEISVTISLFAMIMVACRI